MIGELTVLSRDEGSAMVVRPDGYSFGSNDDPAALLSALRSMSSSPAIVGAQAVASI